MVVSMRKQKLNIEQQIQHMKGKGIQFNIVSEDEARIYLSKNNYYFRLKAYAKNYEKYNSGKNKGKYFNLEFAFLKELAIIDMRLRYLILAMTLTADFVTPTAFATSSIVSPFRTRKSCILFFRSIEFTPLSICQFIILISISSVNTIICVILSHKYY
jgi:hypothetical protein